MKIDGKFWGMTVPRSEVVLVVRNEEIYYSVCALLLDLLEVKGVSPETRWTDANVMCRLVEVG